MTRCRRFALAAVVLVAALVAGCAGGDDGNGPRKSSPAALFDYDRDAPLGFRDRGRINADYPIEIRDVSYASPKRGRVLGYLMVPPGKGKRPAVIYMHGAGGDRRQFILPASWMAARRAVTLTIDSPLVRGAGPPAGRGLPALRRDRDVVAQNVVELRRAVDLLRSRPDVDPDRIAFVGYSAGARAGAILAGVEPRIRAFVFMSGGSAPVSEYARRAPAAIRKDVRRILGQVDPLAYVAKAAPAELYFQAGRTDTVVPPAAVRALYRAASEPKQLKWYRAGHELNVQAYRDQLAWLERELRVAGERVPGAIAGPDPA